jgi:hypothetical protein
MACTDGDGSLSVLIHKLKKMILTYYFICDRVFVRTKTKHQFHDMNIIEDDIMRDDEQTVYDKSS